MKGNIRLIFLFLLVGSFAAKAQTNFYLDGTGRVITKNDKIEGETIKQTAFENKNGTLDTLNVPNKGLSGYQLFDLGLHLERGKSFHAFTMMRARNQFGSFFGQGVDIVFRQITIEGVIGKGIKYELGDIDLEMTPYTLYNFGSPMNDYESSIFQERREILEYENFVDGNVWRLQGANLYSTLLFEKGIEKLYLQGFATRTQPFNNIGRNDRILFGATAQAIQSKHVSLGFNYAGVSDVTIETSDSTYRNNVYTANLGLSHDFGTGVEFGVDGEFGISNRYIKNEKIPTDPAETLDGNFFDVALKGEHKETGIKLKAGFRNVADDFRSPGAQTRRYNDYYGGDDRLFAQVPGQGTDLNYYVAGQRNQLMYDRYTEEGVYNRNLTMVNLGLYNPIYANMHKYGVATNNRTGLYVNFEREGDDKVYNFKVAVDMHKEIDAFSPSVGEREFTGIAGGVKLNIHELLEWKKDFSLLGAYKSETTTRSADIVSNEVDLKTNGIDVGASIEVLDNLFLIYGWKTFNAEGNEFIIVEGAGGQYSEVGMMADTEESVQSFGLKFQLSPKAFISGYWNIVDYTNNDEMLLTVTNDPVTGNPTPSEPVGYLSPSYKINELFLNFTLKF